MKCKCRQRLPAHCHGCRLRQARSGAAVSVSLPDGSDGVTSAWVRARSAQPSAEAVAVELHSYSFIIPPPLYMIHAHGAGTHTCYT